MWLWEFECEHEDCEEQRVGIYGGKTQREEVKRTKSSPLIQLPFGLRPYITLSTISYLNYFFLFLFISFYFLN